MGRYIQYESDKEKENAARRRNDGTRPEDLLIGNQEEYEFLKETIPGLREEKESIHGPLTGEMKAQYLDPTLRFVSCYNGPKNTDLAGKSYQNSCSIVPQYLNPSTGAFTDMYRHPYESVADEPHRSVKTKAEALRSYRTARAESWRQQRREGFKGLKDGEKGKEYCNNPPAPGKNPRGRPKGRSRTFVSSQY